MRSAFSILAEAGRRDAARAMRRRGWAQTAVVFAFLALLTAIIFGAYFFFYHAFSGLLKDFLSGPLIIRYVLESAFAFVYVLGTASFVVSSGPRLFRDDSFRFLAALPIEPSTLFAYQFVGLTLASSWPVLLIAAPALAAFGAVTGAGLFYGFFAASSLFLLVVGIALSGGLIAFAFAPLVRRLSRPLLALTEILLFLGLAFALVRHVIPRTLVKMFEVYETVQVPAAERRINEVFAWFPSHPLARAASSILPTTQPAATAWELSVFVMALMGAALLLWMIARYSYLRLWQSAGETGFLARTEDAPGVRRLPFPRLLRWKHGFLFEKNLLQFFRDGEMISRASSLLLLLALYVFAARALAVIASFDVPENFARAVSFSFAAVGYIALTIAMRFAFPAPSLEERRSWIIKSSPVHAHEMFSWNLFFWASLIAAAMVTVGALVSWVFGFPLVLTLFFIVCALCAAVTVTAVSLGQGTVFLDVETRDPDAMSTSPAGLAAIAVCLAYLWVVTRYVYDFTLNLADVGQTGLTPLIGVLIVSLALCGAYWAWAAKAVEGGQ